MRKSTEGKIQRIQALLKRKDEIEKELEGLLSSEKIAPLPANFSINEEVLRVVKESGNTGIDTKQIFSTLRQKYPSYGIERIKIANALSYLKNNKKQIKQIGRGIYATMDLGAS